MKSQKRTPAEKEIDHNGKNIAMKEVKPRSMWELGTGNSKKPSSLCIPAACVLMGISYGARMARYDLIRPVQSLATYLHEWDADCDARLNRLVSYVQSYPTLELPISILSPSITRINGTSFANLSM